MSKPSIFLRCALGVTLAGLLLGCDTEPQLQWNHLSLDEVGLEFSLPCEAQVAQTPVDFGLDIGRVPVNMLGCDALDSTYAVSHWLLNDAKQADDALAFWQAAVLTRLQAVDGEDEKSGAPFVPLGAMELQRSIRATVQGIGPAGWTITTHGVWFARKEGDKARIFHAVIYAPKPQHGIANTFFKSLVLK